MKYINIYLFILIGILCADNFLDYLMNMLEHK